MAITKCLIWVPPVNRFTVVPMVLEQCGLRVDGLSRPIWKQQETDMNAHETSENRELTVCELEQVSGGILGEKYLPLYAGLYGLFVYTQWQGTLNEGLHR